MKIVNPLTKLDDLKPLLAKVFNFSRKELLIILSVASAIILIAVIIGVISVVRTSSIEKQQAEAHKEFLPAEDNDKGATDFNIPFLSDFMLDDASINEAFTGFVYSREGGKKWTDEDIKEYWVDPKIIATEQLEEASDAIIQDIFADVP